MTPRPPRGARWIVEALLPPSDAGAMTGDLDEEYRRFVLPERGAFRAGLWYWRQVLFSVPAMLRGRGREPSSAGWLGGDVRHALRLIIRRPGFSLSVVATLALGLGVNTSVFSVVHAVLVAPLPFQDADRLVRLQPNDLFFTDAREAQVIDERMTTLETFVPWGRSFFSFSYAGETDEVRGALVGWKHFDMLGAQPLLGRTFIREDAASGDAVVLSHRIWVRRFGADLAVVGSTVDFSGGQKTVVGVMGPEHVPMEFDWQIWGPLPLDPEPVSNMGLAGNARLAVGATLAQAVDEARRVVPEIWREGGYVATPEDIAGIEMAPLRDWLLGDAGQALLVLSGAVAFLVLLMCANVANLLLAHTGSRSREFSVRAALGGSRSRVARQLFVEVMVLTSLGALIALGASYVSMGWVVALLPADLPRADSISVSPVVMAFTAGSALLVALITGLAPAMRSASRALGALASGGRGSTAGSRRIRARSALVAAEVAIAVVLVVGAGLMVRTMLTLSNVDPGFEADRVVTLRPTPPAVRYEAGPELEAYYARLTDELLRLPGVESVGAIQFLPMTPGGWWSGYLPEGMSEPEEANRPSTAVRVVREGYFETMRIPVLRGRAVTSSEGWDGGESVAMINEALAAEAFAGTDPIGKSIRIGDGAEFRIVGIVGDVRQSDVRTASHAELYLPFGERPWRRMHMVVRTSGDPEQLVALTANAVRQVDGGVSILGPRLMEDVVGGTMGNAKLITTLLTLFGVLGLGLGAVGVYGVAAQVVAERRREIGIRIALGAATGLVATRTIMRGMIPVAVGSVVGIVVALSGSSVLEGVLYGIEATDVATFVAAPFALALIALVALSIPAVRASRVDPVRTLREE